MSERLRFIKTDEEVSKKMCEALECIAAEERKEGHKLGKKEGLAIGREKGKKEGREQERKMLARKMKKLGYSDEQVQALLSA